jgi:hypothetical protein
MDCGFLLPLDGSTARAIECSICIVVFTMQEGGCSDRPKGSKPAPGLATLQQASSARRQKLRFVHSMTYLVKG